MPEAQYILLTSLLFVLNVIIWCSRLTRVIVFEISQEFHDSLIFHFVFSILNKRMTGSNTSCSSFSLIEIYFDTQIFTQFFILLRDVKVFCLTLHESMTETTSLIVIDDNNKYSTSFISWRGKSKYIIYCQILGAVVVKSKSDSIRVEK
jgi:hypothetical protein